MSIWSLLGYVICVVVIVYGIAVTYCWISFKRQSKIYNDGIAPSGSYWEIYNVNSKGDRYYKDHKGDNLCCITWREIDKELTGYQK